MKSTFIQSLIFCNHLFSAGSWWGWSQSQSSHWARVGFTLDKSPVDHRADIQRQPFTLTFTDACVWTLEGNRKLEENPHRHRKVLPQLGIEPTTFLMWGNSANHWSTFYIYIKPSNLTLYINTHLFKITIILQTNFRSSADQLCAQTVGLFL